MRRLILGCAVASVLAGASAPCRAWEEELRTEKRTESYRTDPSKPLEIVLEISVGRLVVEPAESADTVSIGLEFTEGKFRGRVDYNERRQRLSVRLSKRSWKAGKNVEEHDKADVTVRVPHGVEVFLDSRLKAGEADYRLGGLRLKAVDLTTWAGETDVEFAVPNAVPMDQLVVDTKVGEIDLRQLGNARFREAYIDGGIGELRADFSGAVEPDCRAKIDLDIGEAVLTLPQSAGVRVAVGGMTSFMSAKQISGGLTRRGRYYYSEDYDTRPEKCTFVVTPGLGELRIERGR
jgi:hypothetical protein